MGYHRVVFRSDNEPFILSLLRAVKLAWTGDAVQETSAEGEPNPKGAAESSVNVVTRTCQMIKLEQWSQLRVSKCQQTMICRRGLCRVQPACTVGLKKWVETARQHDERKLHGKARCSPLDKVRMNECGGCLCSHNNSRAGAAPCHSPFDHRKVPLGLMDGSNITIDDKKIT